MTLLSMIARTCNEGFVGNPRQRFGHATPSTFARAKTAMWGRVLQDSFRYMTMQCFHARCIFSRCETDEKSLRRKPRC